MCWVPLRKMEKRKKERVSTVVDRFVDANEITVALRINRTCEMRDVESIFTNRIWQPT